MQNSLKKKFINRRIAPQEILQPNEEIEVADEEAEMEVDEENAPKTNGAFIKQNEEEEEDSEEQIVEAQNQNSDQLDFTSIKFASKYAAFLKVSSKDNLLYVYYSTNNVSAKCEIPPRKELIENGRF